jgi:hypothetical protein
MNLGLPHSSPAIVFFLQCVCASVLMSYLFECIKTFQGWPSGTWLANLYDAVTWFISLVIFIDIQHSKSSGKWTTFFHWSNKQYWCLKYGIEKNCIIRWFIKKVYTKMMRFRLRSGYRMPLTDAWFGTLSTRTVLD